MSETDAMVFVVDDDAPMRESLKNLIRSVGLRVELFGSAQEFLRSKRPDLPSCLVLDVRLPGLSGLDLQKRTAAGLLNKQIGAELGTSETTIKIHRHQVMEKMGARSLPELVRMVDRLEILVPKS